MFTASPAVVMERERDRLNDRYKESKIIGGKISSNEVWNYSCGGYWGKSRKTTECNIDAM